MADNYLEKRYDACFGAGRTKVRRVGPTFDQLLLRNRSTRGYLKDYVVSRDELERIAAVCSRIPSARNQQVLRLRLVTRDGGADRVLPLVKMGAALPELHLPLPGTEPEAFIVVCAAGEETKLVDMDLGIAAQTMLLKTASMGLSVRHSTCRWTRCWCWPSARGSRRSSWCPPPSPIHVPTIVATAYTMCPSCN